MCYYILIKKGIVDNNTLQLLPSLWILENLHILSLLVLNH